MPEHPLPKLHPHPVRRPGPGSHEPCDSVTRPSNPGRIHRYAELQVTSNYTFLTGASQPEELVAQAAELGHEAIAITDLNTLAGVVRAHTAAEDAGLRLIVGSRLQLQADHDRCSPRSISLLVYPTDIAAYGRLCRLLTLGKRSAPKGECHLNLHQLLEYQDGLLAVLLPPAVLHQACLEELEGLRRWFTDDRLSIAASCLYSEDDRGRLRQLISLSQYTGVPLVASNDVHYHAAHRRPLQDVLTCIRYGCTIEQAGLKLFPNGERRLKPPEEMARLFAEHPRAIRRTLEIMDRTSGFSMNQLRYQYPDEICPAGVSPMQYLSQLTWSGAAKCYPRGMPDKVRDQIRRELTLIEELSYAPYFLTVQDLVNVARKKGILCQGRGAAANSAVCYCLGVTAVDPDRINLLFERFISRERNEPPDIDIDFEHERREEVIQYIYGKYGRDRAALTAEVISYRGRSAMREVGKALGLSLDLVDRLAKNIDWWSDRHVHAERLREQGLDPDDPIMRRFASLVTQIMGFPRHLSQHVGGFVITRGPLCELVPIENARMADRTVIEWDKDDVDAMGMLKVDVLGLGMLTCVRKSFELVERHHGRSLTTATVPAEDPAVYEMICRADTVGVFQIESRAQMQMLPRLRPDCFYDLVIEVAIVRPGPIQGDMVHPYLRRRHGLEKYTFPNEEVRKVLGKTLGVPLFQEQAMSLAIVAAGFTPGEADQLRRAMAAWKRKGDLIVRFEEKFIRGMLDRGYDPDFAARCFSQLRGFSEYGFPESHAASFALIVYVSAWLKKHYPAAFAAGLINSQPMGFYAPAQIVRDAQEHGVTVRPVDVNHSRWDCTLEDPPAGSSSPLLRLGMRLVKGLQQAHADQISLAVQEQGGFDSIESLRRIAAVPVAALRRLASADAFGSMGMDRQSALWQVRVMRDEKLPIFESVDPEAQKGAGMPAKAERAILPAIPLPSRVMQDYASTSLSLKAHPLSFIREMLDRRRVARAGELRDERRWPQRRHIAVAGIVLVRQRPSTASGVVFITVEDETGVANLIVRPRIFEQYRNAARHSTVLLARGWVERQGEVVHIMTRSIEKLDDHLAELTSISRDFH